IEAIVADTEGGFASGTLWPPDPVEAEQGDPEQALGLYLGAAGIVWGLHALERGGAAELRRDWEDLAASLPERVRPQPDLAEDVFLRGLWMGASGVLLVAHAFAPTPDIHRALLECVRANARHPSLELAWGSTGTMLSAQVMHERTGDPVWMDAWRES